MCGGEGSHKEAIGCDSKMMVVASTYIASFEWPPRSALTKRASCVGLPLLTGTCRFVCQDNKTKRVPHGEVQTYRGNICLETHWGISLWFYVHDDEYHERNE